MKQNNIQEIDKRMKKDFKMLSIAYFSLMFFTLVVIPIDKYWFLIGFIFFLTSIVFQIFWNRYFVKK